MAICVGVPYRKYEEIRACAEQFLAAYHPEHTLPIPIEFIVDEELGIQIWPRDGLFERYGIDGCYTAQCDMIMVDKGFMQTQPFRYNFTIAHEMGHIQMHQDLFREYVFSTPDKWIDFQMNLSEKSARLMEFQAHSFAGVVLVPSDHLYAELRSLVQNPDLREKASKALRGGLEQDRVEHSVREVVAKQLSRRFEASPEVISRRIGYENMEILPMLFP